MTRMKPVPRRPLVIAHRGASAYAPENTFAAFDLAVEMGAPAIETDVHATADGHLVLLHDERVDRTTNGHGNVSEIDLAEVARLDAGSWFAPQFAGQRVPTVEELFARYGHRVLIRLEVKAPGIEGPLVDLVREAGLLAEEELASFHLDTVARLSALAPEAHIGYIVGRIDQETIREAVSKGASLITARADLLTREAIQDARGAGLAVGAWALRDDSLLMKVFALGVDSLTTNWPDRALRLLASAS